MASHNNNTNKYKWASEFPTENIDKLAISSTLPLEIKHQVSLMVLNYSVFCLLLWFWLDFF